MLKNQDIRQYAKDKSIAHWRIAEHLNIGENTLTRRLRRELTPQEKQVIFNAIDELSKEN